MFEDDGPAEEAVGCCVSFVCLPVMLDRIDKTILIGIITIAMIIEISPFEEFEIALWIGITVRAVLGVNPNWRNDCDSSSEVKRRFGKDVPRTNLNIVLINDTFCYFQKQIGHTYHRFDFQQRNHVLWITVHLHQNFQFESIHHEIETRKYILISFV